MKAIIVSNPQVKVVICDRARENLALSTWLNDRGVSLNPSELGRDLHKHMQEAVVRDVKRALSWCIRRLEEVDPAAPLRWKVLPKTAAFVLNTRASTVVKAIPWFLRFKAPPRLELQLFQHVTVVQSSKMIVIKSKAEHGYFLGQESPTSALWLTSDGELASCDPSALRQPLVSVRELLIQSHLSFNALSVQSNKLPRGARSSQEFRDAVRSHVSKIMKFSPFRLAGKIPPDAPIGDGMFIGRMQDGEIKARLVANGSLTSDTELDSSLPLYEHRFMFLTQLTRRLSQGHIPFAGDFSSAYYATRGDGYLRLPGDWPNDPAVSQFHPRQVVRLNCAIPGDALSSGLFLQQAKVILDEHLGTPLSVCSYQTNDCTLIHYSDDVLGSASSPAVVSELQSVIGRQFTVDFSFEIPPKWVSLDLTLINGEIHATLLSTARNYLDEPRTLVLSRLRLFELTSKSTDAAAISAARTWAGRLNFLANAAPCLGWFASFLSSALYYDPVRSVEFMKDLIAYYIQRPKPMRFLPTHSSFLALYTDASHSRGRYRGHTAFHLQAQETSDPEEEYNVIAFSSKAIDIHVADVYEAELIAIDRSLKSIAPLWKAVCAYYPDLPLVVFNDNEKAVQAVNADAKYNPFVGDLVEGVRKRLDFFRASLRHCSSGENLADIGTKPHKW